MRPVKTIRHYQKEIKESHTRAQEKLNALLKTARDEENDADIAFFSISKARLS